MTEWIDSHLHLWQPARMRYPWLDGIPALDRAYGPSDLDTGGHELAGAVFVEAGRVPEQAMDEVEWVEELAGGRLRIAAMVAHAPVELGDEVAPHLAALAAHPLVTGVRRNIQDEPPGYATSDAFVAGVRRLAAHGYSFDLCVRDHQLPEATALVDRVPEVRFVLDHLGKPGVAEGRLDPWRADLTRLAARDNVVCKLSGLATEAATGADPAAWRDEDVRPYLRHALDAFGPHRCLYGGDWPVATLATPYSRWLEVVAAAIGDLPEPDRSAVRAGNARRVYRVPTPGQRE